MALTALVADDPNRTKAPRKSRSAVGLPRCYLSLRSTGEIAGETARVRHAAWRRGGVAARGARAAVERPTSSARADLPCQQNRKGRSSCKSCRFSEQKFTGLRKAVMTTRRDFLIGAAAAGLPSIINSGIAGPASPVATTNARENNWDQGWVQHLLPTVNHDRLLIKASFDRSLSTVPELH